MKVIAYYLPQFHQVKENDDWWGEGFTEWTNTRKMKPLEINHYQPREPLNENYYDLNDKKVMEWQAELAVKYGVYGFCYYHYWFSGRKLLEKPAENLLKWKDINKKFMFCWANHSWYKSSKDINKQLLIEQTYGKEDEWEEHFTYLLQFFKDNRYIKIDNKPTLMIFDAKRIPELDKRLQFYNRRAIEEGFEGIHIIESINSSWSFPTSNFSQAVVFREPAISISGENKLMAAVELMKRKYTSKIKVHKFNEITRKSKKYTLKKVKNPDLMRKKQIYLGTFTDWDNTSRHGKKGSYIKDASPNLFEEYLRWQKETMLKYNIDYIFINAWNEWAEGMYLEPDCKFGFSYLEKIRIQAKKQ